MIAFRRRAVSRVVGVGALAGLGDDDVDDAERLLVGAVIRIASAAVGASSAVRHRIDGAALRG